MLSCLRSFAVFCACAGAAAVLVGQDRAAPKVVSLSPTDHNHEVDAATTTVLVVTFDAPMQQKGYSFCGGGPQFPKFRGVPVWKDEKTIAVEVELEPDHDYTMSLNCPAAQNFRSAGGVALAPVPWRFSTLPKELPDPAVQQARNAAAFERLVTAIDGRYSYRDLRLKDWDKVYADAKPALLGARTDRLFAIAAAAMLKPTADLHLYVRHGDRTYSTGSRSVDHLFRRALVDRQFKMKQFGRDAFLGRSADGIGCVLIGSWGRHIDIAAIELGLADLRSCKAIVVDARPNSGGDEMLARRVAAWFVTGTKGYAKHRTRTGPGVDGFGPVGTRELTGNGDERRFDVPIAVLIGPGVMSSNESFVMMLQQAADCTLVGQPTYGSSGNPKPHDLGNGVTVMLPSWQDLRLDGSCLEGEGVQPDVRVECNDELLQLGDPILGRALELLRSKIAGAGKQDGGK